MFELFRGISEAIYDTTVKTGIVLIPMFLTGLVGWYCILSVWRFTSKELKRSRFMSPDDFERLLLSGRAEDIRRRLGPGHSATHEFVAVLLKDRGDSRLGLGMKCREVLLDRVLPYSRILSTAGVMATLAPLLGLLGTVNGMIVTFYIISLYGSANPVLMAAGISEALLATQAGLSVAFPILFLHTLLKGRLKGIRNQLEQFHLRYDNAVYLGTLSAPALPVETPSAGPEKPEAPPGETT